MVHTVLTSKSALLLSLLAACGGETPMPGETPWPTSGWQTAAPAEQGLAAGPIASVDSGIRAGRFGYVDRLVVVKNGQVVVSERYENNYAEISRDRRDALGCSPDMCHDSVTSHEFNYYHPSTHPFYQGRRVHTLQSVTKSVAATVVGIALQRGEIEGLDVPLLTFFGDYDLSNVEARLHRATLEDLLTMRTGIEWHETDRPPDETNTTFQLEKSPDWIQFTLDQPMDADPGEKWAYNSGGSHLISGVIRKVTGRFADAYAQEYLFGPLGIPDYHWKKTPRGYPDTEGGLYLEAEELAKIGYLYLNDGTWEGKRILPEGWVAAATARHADPVNQAGWGYGYQWWRLDRDGVDIWAGLGFGGQFLLVFPQHDMIGVINSWNLFGSPNASVLEALIEALLAAVST